MSDVASDEDGQQVDGAGDPDEDRRPRTSGRWPLIALGIVLVAAAAFAIGRFTTLGAAASGPNAADIGFARDMQVHHAQAVEMAMVEYAATGNDDLRYTAYDIATGQASQSGEMYDWLVQWGVAPYGSDPLMQWMQEAPGHHDAPSDATDEELRAAMGMATEQDLARLRETAGTDEGDCLFIELMTRHHEGAIEMTDAIAELGSNPRVRQVASAMAETQQREIDALRDIGGQIGCA